MAIKNVKTAAILGCAMLLGPAALAQSSAPVWSDPVNLHHQMQYRIMAETSRELALITERMARGPLSVEERKAMSGQIARISRRMQRMSGLEGRPAHNHAGLQKQMEQMRALLAEIERTRSTP